MKKIFYSSHPRRRVSIREWIPTFVGMTIIFLAMTVNAHALTVDAKLPNTAQEARAQHLFSELRCVVCAGESVADSPAEVAADMRRSVRGSIAAGLTDEQIKEALVEHYGERVLMMPALNERNALLFAAPLVLLLAGLLLAWRKLFSGNAP